MGGSIGHRLSTQETLGLDPSLATFLPIFGALPDA